MLRHHRHILAAALFALALATAVAAQDLGWFRNRFRGPEPRFPTADSFDGYFNFCRGMYYSDRREAGGQGWWTDYSAADVNFSIRLSELTKTRVSRTSDGQPNHLVIRLTDDELFQCPFVEMEDVGTARFSDEEVKRLREYLLKGGFVWVDDFWGGGVVAVGRGDPTCAAEEGLSDQARQPGSPDLPDALPGVAVKSVQ